MGNLWKQDSDSSSTSSSSTRPSSPGIAQNASNEGTHSGPGGAFSTRLDEDLPNGQILTTPNLTFTFAEFETATRNFWREREMGDSRIPHFDSSSTSLSSTRPSSSLGIPQNTSNEGTHSGTGSAFLTRVDEDFPNGQILTTPNLTFTSAELETATRNFRPVTVRGIGCSFKQKLVVHVDMHDAKSRSQAMKIAVGLPGVISATIEADKYQNLTVVGDGVDAINLTKQLRKRMSSKLERLFCISIVSSELVSVSPVDEKQKDKEKKPESIVAWPQRDSPPQPNAQAPTVPQTRVSLFLDHVVRSCDRSIAANVDVLSFINSIKKKVERFRSTFGTTYQDYDETCSTSASEDDDTVVRTVRTPKHARIKGKSSKNPAKKPQVSINAPLMIEDSLIKALTSHTLDEEQKHEVDASNLNAAFGDEDDIPIEDLISVSPDPQGYNTPLKVTSQAIIVSSTQATTYSLIWRCKHIPKLRKIPDRFIDYQHPLPQTGYILTEVEKELLMDFYKYYTHRKEELDMIISCVDSKSLRDLLDEGTWMDSTIIYLWFEVLRERCKDAYFADPSICSFSENDLKIGDDMAFGPTGERVMDAMDCKTLVYVLHAHNHWSLLVGYVDENRWEYYNSSKGEIWGHKICERFRLWLQQRFMDHGWSVPMVWTMTKKTDIPFQDNGNDCGLFACAFVEHCIYRRPIMFTQSDIPYYRRRIVIDIFEQNWIQNASKLNLPSLPVLPPDLQ